MPRHIRTLALAAALAVSALAAPAALAQPTDSVSPQARNAAATAASATSARTQDLRRLRAERSLHSAATTGSQFTPGYTPGARGREAYYSRSHSRSVLPGDHHATHGAALADQQPARTADTDDGVSWTMIALGLGGAFLLIAMLAVTRRARLRTRIAA
jgi:hypothetical protein